MTCLSFYGAGKPLTLPFEAKIFPLTLTFSQVSPLPHTSYPQAWRRAYARAVWPEIQWTRDARYQDLIRPPGSLLTGDGELFFGQVSSCLGFLRYQKEERHKHVLLLVNLHLT